MTPFEVQNLWQEYYPKVFGYFFRRISNREDVEDLTSLTLTAFVDNLTNKSIQNPHAFLWKIAHNQLLVFIRFKQKQPIPISLEEDFEVEVEATDNSQNQHALDRIKNLMHCVEQNLSGIELIIVKGIIQEERSSAELATELNLKADNVRQKLSRSLKKLREKCTELWQN